MKLSELNPNEVKLVSEPAPLKLSELNPNEVKVVSEAAMTEGDLVAKVSSKEVADIAKRHGVKPETLESYVPLYNALLSDKETGPIDYAKFAAGEVSEAVLLGLPQWAKKRFGDEKEGAALDELQQLIDSRKTWYQIGAEIVGGAVIPTGAANLIGKVAKGGSTLAKVASNPIIASGAIGGVANMFHSKEGEQLEGLAIGAATGAIGGAVLTGAVKGLSRMMGKSGKVPAATGEVADEVSDVQKIFKGDDGADLERKVNEKLVQNSYKEEVLEQAATLQDDSINSFEKWSKKIGEKELPSLTKQLPEEWSDVATPMGRMVSGEAKHLNISTDGPEFQKFLAYKRVQDEILDFAHYLKKPRIESVVRNQTKRGYSSEKRFTEAIETIREKIAQEGIEDISRNYKAYQAARVLLDEMGTKLLKKIPHAKTNPIRKIVNFFIDGRLGRFRSIGRRLGIDIEPEVDRWSRINAGHTVRAYERNTKLNLLERGFSKLNINQEEAFEAVRRQDFSKFSKEQRKAIELVSTYFEESRNIANKQANQEIITKWKGTKGEPGYVPHIAVDLPQYIAKIHELADRVVKKSKIDVRNHLTPQQYHQIKDDADFLTLVKGVENLLGRKIKWEKSIKGAKEKVASTEAFNVFLKKSLNPETAREKFVTMARASHLRDGEIPEFFLEKNILELARAWTHNTFRHLYFREMIEGLQKYRNMAAVAGDADATKYLHDLIKDLVGSRSATVASWSNAKANQLRILGIRTMRNTDNGFIKRAAGYFGNAGPEIWSTMTNQLYPNFLGWFKIRPLSQNAAQPIMMTMPELATGYGYALATGKVIKAYGEMFKALALKKNIRLERELADYFETKAGEPLKTRNLATILRNRGLMSVQYNTELASSIRPAGMGTKGGRAIKKAIDATTQFAMLPFEWSEVMNRFVSTEVGLSVAKDLMAGSKHAIKFVNESGNSGLRRKLETALKARNEAQIQELLVDHVLAKTQFNYNRLTMNEYGRFMGPLFSVFTKWPASVAGDIVNTYAERGAIGGTKNVAVRYAMAPLFAYMVIDHLIVNNLMSADPEYSEVSKRIVGRGGVRSMAPIWSGEAFYKGDFMQPPVLQTATDLIQGVANADPKQLEDWAQNAVLSFGPTAGLWHFLFEDVPVYMRALD